MKISTMIDELAKKGRPKVAIALTSVTVGIAGSLKRASQFAEITIVGEGVSGYKCIEISKRDNSYESQVAKTLSALIKNNDVGAIVRGNASASAIMGELALNLGYSKIPRVAIIRDVKSREFLLTPASVTEGNSLKERIHMAKGAADFLISLGIEPHVCIGQIENVRERSERIAQSMDEAEFIAEELRRHKIDISFIGYAVETAIEQCNIVVPANGIIGNAIWRTITGIGGCSDLGDFGLIKEIFVDDSQYWDDYFQPIYFAAALANRIKDSTK